MPPRTIRREAVFGGPFTGFSSDSANWYKGQGGLWQDCENVDFLKGQMITRPGMSLVTSQATMRAISSWDTGVYTQYTDSTSKILGLSASVGSSVFAWCDYNYFRNTLALGIFPNDVATYVPPSKRGNAQQYDYQTGTTTETKAGIVGGSGAGRKEVKNNYGGALTDPEKPHWDKLFLPGSYIYFATNPEFLKIVQQSSLVQIAGNTASVFSSTDAVSTHSDQEYQIVPPLRGIDATTFLLWDGVQGSSSTKAMGLDLSAFSTITRIPGTNQYYMGGWFGGAFLDFDNMATGSGFGQTDASGNRFAARASCYYYDRLILATPYSVSCIQSDAVAHPTYLRWQLNPKHAGRLVWSASGAPRDFLTLGTGQTDLEIGDIYDLFVMRDVMYAVGQNGLASMQKTGNSYMPFRAQTILFSDEFFDSPAVVVEGAYAVLQTTRGPVKFDGGSLQPFGDGMRELCRGSDQAYSGAYDYTRNRVLYSYIPPNGTKEKAIGVGTEDNYLVRYATTAASPFSNIYKIIPFGDAGTDGIPTTEFLFLEGQSASAGIWKVDRSVMTDGGNAIDWTATSPVLDTSTSRDNKSCDRIRITYEDWADTSSSANNISVTLYIDGGVNPPTGFPVTVNLTGTGSKATKTANVTFPPKTGQQWCVKLSGSSTKKVVINQIALYFVDRVGAKPF